MNITREDGFKISIGGAVNFANRESLGIQTMSLLQVFEGETT